MEERKAKGLLWTDTEEAMAAQRKARGLCYDFNHIHPSESDRRNAMLSDIFGEVGEDVWIEPPLTCAFGKTVKIGRGTYIRLRTEILNTIIKIIMYRRQAISSILTAEKKFLYLI